MLFQSLNKSSREREREMKEGGVERREGGGGDGVFSGCVISATSSTAGAPAGSPAWPYAAWAAPIAPIILGGGAPTPNPPAPLLRSHYYPPLHPPPPRNNFCGAKHGHVVLYQNGVFLYLKLNKGNSPLTRQRCHSDACCRRRRYKEQQI